MRLFLDADEPSGDGWAIDGLIPKIIVAGAEVKLDERDKSPRRRCLIALRREGHHDDEEGANVGKSRIYISRGRLCLRLAADTPESSGQGMFTSASKKRSSLLGASGFLELGDMTIRLGRGEKALAMDTREGGAIMKGTSSMRSSSTAVDLGRFNSEGCVRLDEEKCKGLGDRFSALAAMQ
jgi:hypothetical protein